MNDVELLDQVRKIVADAYQAAKTREPEEIAAGRVLRNDPVARQMAWGNATGDVPLGAKWVEAFIERKGKERSPNIVFTGESTYLESRRRWGAYRAACGLLSGDEDAGYLEACFYDIFHYVPGVMAIVRNPLGRVLVCIRSHALGGTHPGTLSFPAGLMKPGEQIQDAIVRQVADETGIHLNEHTDWRDDSVFVARNPDAPQSVYCQEVIIPDTNDELNKTWEAKGGRFIWLPTIWIRAALRHDMRDVMRVFGEAGIDLEQPPHFAPDAHAAAKEFLSR